jgi:hypothetical protein
MKTQAVPKEVRKYFSKIGKAGGSVSSPAKREANRANVRKRWEKWREEHASK